MWPARVPGSYALWPFARDGLNDICPDSKKMSPDGSSTCKQHYAPLSNCLEYCVQAIGNRVEIEQFQVIQKKGNASLLPIWQIGALKIEDSS